MQRLAMDSLIAWKSDSFRKPLVLLGARQVGKTWLMLEFGKTYFLRTAYIRFDRNEVMRAVFEKDYDLSRILMAMQVEVGFPIEASSTLIVFDEIQACPAALTSLKYFCEEAREYHIIAAGSLLGLSDQAGTGFPVGKVDRLNLYPMTFSEFLLAEGQDQLFQLLARGDWSLIKAFGDRFEELLRYYYVVGGMPEVVDAFVRTRDLGRVRRLQLTLLADYQADFGKHATGDLRPKIAQVWDAIPVQLARENKRFVYSELPVGGGRRELESSLRWLLDTGLVTMVERVSKPAVPLQSYGDGAFKLFFLDVGLLAAKAGLSAKVILEGHRIFQEFKGALTEQYVQQQLLGEFGVRSYYWANGRGQAEVDFLIETENGVVPIEVKAEQNLQAKSLKVFCEKFQPGMAVRTSMHAYFKQEIPFQQKCSETSADGYHLVDIPLYGLRRLADELE